MLDIVKVRQSLKDYNFRSLFIEELGWDRYDVGLNVSVDGHNFSLKAVAEKRGMVVFTFQPKDDGEIPDYAMRRKLERQVTKSAHEHIIIYIDSKRTIQIWQWVKREPGKPTACREQQYYSQQTGEALIQKLRSLVVTLEDEEKITLPDITGRARAAFDVERVTKKFYVRFETEHGAFLKFIEGIPDENMGKWYASVMLNRLMFIYFIQKKGFLNSDIYYLRTKLNEIKRQKKDSYYREFLCPLFFEGFAKQDKDRSDEYRNLLGIIPYLNGGIFQKHQIEEYCGKEIQISDYAFEKLFAFFEQYNWHLDERPLRADNEINPDVLGYIFEKYINQKQMGAYYTKEDITEYIGKNTIVPYLFDAAEKKCKIAFEGDNSFWRLLQEDPDRYIYDAVRRGVIDKNGEIIPESALPEFVQIDMNDAKARMFDKRYNLTEAFLPDENGINLTLPTETWREYVERRKRCLELREKLARGEVRNINDLITYNLNIRQFAQDVIENCEGPELLRAFWYAINGRIPEKSNENFEYGVTILDPACGSGAFLFAALNILEPLYEACLQRMEIFLAEQENIDPASHKYFDFRAILQKVAEHPNRRYFTLKSIIVNNLFGVDIMEEAVEICKLRMFLKLVAQIEDVNLIEPLPDIDFNIRAGNSLVGFTNADEVRRAMTSFQSGQMKLLSDDELESYQRFEDNAHALDKLFTLFRQQQTVLGGEIKQGDKIELRRRLSILEEMLNQYLASEYGVNLSNNRDYDKWLKSHKPFHWFIEFYGIMRKGGFDVIIGNPPYVDFRKVRSDYTITGYKTLTCNNLYAYLIERSLEILLIKGYFGMIVPIASVSTDNMSELQKYYNGLLQWHSHFAVRPGKLFVGVDMNLTITLINKTCEKDNIFVTGYKRWTTGINSERPYIFPNLAYIQKPAFEKHANPFPKIGTKTEIQVLEKMLNFGRKLNSFENRSGKELYYHSGGRYWRKALPNKISSHYKPINIPSETYSVVFALLNSQLFYWYWISNSNCMDVVSREVSQLPVFLLNKIKNQNFDKLHDDLLKSFFASTSVRTREGIQIQTTEINFDVGKSKPIIDQIDCALAEHYGFTDEELDFIINYDIKYRMGLHSGGNAEGEDGD